MSTSFSLADQDVTDLLDDVMRDRHRPLFDAGVKVGVIMAVSDTGDAVTHAATSALSCLPSTLPLSLPSSPHTERDSGRVDQRVEALLPPVVRRSHRPTSTALPT